VWGPVTTGAKREGIMLREGDKTPAVTGTSYDGRTFELAAPGRPTVLWFYPKAATGG
jgi:peroxiredoxin